MSRPRLHLADPAAAVPDTRASIARVLLKRCAPVTSPVADHVLSMLTPDGGRSEQYDELQSDPRYLVGCLSHALTALLSADIPSPDATAQLLAEALEDAVSYRRRTCARCELETESGVCPECWPSWQQANAYEGLALSLGIVADVPPPRLRAVASGDGR